MSIKLAAEKFAIFCKRFETEQDCLPALFSSKWPTGYVCPRCRHPEFYLISTRRLPLYECRSCRAQTSLISETIMAGSRTPIHLWFRAIYLHTQPNSINALQLSEAIGVTYKTAWLICHKIRHAMGKAESEQFLSGIVRVSDSVYCRRLSASFDWHKQEQPLLVGTSDDDARNIAKLKIKLQSKSPLKDKYDCPDMTPFIKEFVDPLAAPQVIKTRRYGRNMNKSLAWMGYDVTWWIGRIFRGIGPKHLQAYLNQFCYSWNHSGRSLFKSLLSDCARFSRITYSDLTHTSAVTRSSRHSRDHMRISSKTG
ncbi:transposase [Cohnella herbarum]|uniref:Transposase n=1 Tax=Cohnella herbarum TaxID=2728023 RepID=A0A7Z2ZK25_9BACL|nr:transposase [Cohnella herbarum]QJD82324.1 transposase [Cohnella herbarum]